jgi:hypothetical protein
MKTSEIVKDLRGHAEYLEESVKFYPNRFQAAETLKQAANLIESLIPKPISELNENGYYYLFGGFLGHNMERVDGVLCRLILLTQHLWSITVHNGEKPPYIENPVAYQEPTHFIHLSSIQKLMDLPEPPKDESNA